MNAGMHSSGERGSAMIVAVVFVVVMFGIGGGILSMSLMEDRATSDRMEMEGIAGATDAALATACGRIMADAPPPHTITGTTAASGVNRAGGVSWAVSISQNTANESLFKVTVASGRSRTVAGRTQQGNLLSNEEVDFRTAQAIVEKPEPPLPPVPTGVGGAVNSYFGLAIQAGSVVINGNNKKFDGSDAGGGYTAGISTAAVEDDVTLKGTFLGNGDTTGTTDTGDAIDKGSLKVGMTDVPNTPGRVLGLKDEDLTDPSKNPTYFTTKGAFDTWFAANKYPITVKNKDGVDETRYVVPNTSPIYLAFTETDIPNMFDPDKSYIFINHVPKDGVYPAEGAPPNGTATTKNVQINFKGVIIMDDWLHINAGSTFRGTMASLFGGPGVQEKFAQGGAQFEFSSQAIGLALRDAGDVEPPPPTSGPKILSFVENPSSNDRGTVEVLKACGVLPGSTQLPATDHASGVNTGWSETPQ